MWEIYSTSYNGVVRCVIYAERLITLVISQRASIGGALIIHLIMGEIGRRMALYLGSIPMTRHLPRLARDFSSSMD